jgi:hypothetical protein
MFLIMGVNQSQKPLSFSQQTICECCGRYGRYESFMTYMNFNLFFIPIIKWQYKYYFKTSCCNALYELNPEYAQPFKSGDIDHLTCDMIHLVQQGRMEVSEAVKCDACGYLANEAFLYCPKCGKPLRR